MKFDYKNRTFISFNDEFRKSVAKPDVRSTNCTVKRSKLNVNNNPMYGEDIPFSLKIPDIEKNEAVQKFVKIFQTRSPENVMMDNLFKLKEDTNVQNSCSGGIKNGPSEIMRDNSNTNEVVSKFSGTLAELLEPIASNMDIPLENLVKPVYIHLESSGSNDAIQNGLCELLGFESLDIISEILSCRRRFISKSPEPKVKVDRRNDCQQPNAGTFTMLLDSIRNDNAAVQKKHYPFVFDRTADIKAAGISGEKYVLSKDDRSWKDSESETIYLAPVKHDRELLDVSLVSVASMDRVCREGFQGMKELNLIQSVVFETAYGSNENLLISAPTGAGKTNIAMLTVLHQIKQHTCPDGRIRTADFKIIYVAPMKALAAEMASTFQRRLKSLGIVVKECTGDMQLTKVEISSTQMLVTTPEKYDVLTRKGSGDMQLVRLVKLLIIDEVHLLHQDRGAVVESIVARTLRQIESSQSMIRIVGLSATLPNYLDVAEFLNVNPQKGLFYFDSRFRPVPLHQTIVGVKGGNQILVKNLDEQCYKQVLHYLRNNHQVMVFVHSRNETSKMAKKLLTFMRERQQFQLIDNQLGSKTQKQFEKRAQKSVDTNVRELVPYGFGCHNAGMKRPSRDLVETGFKDGHIRVLVSTATLAWGVNLPAHAVIICGTEYYNSEMSRTQDIGILDVLQIFGRAGRPQFDTEGQGIILCKLDKMSAYLTMLTHQKAIESKFLKSLNDNLNAEIALGTVSNVDEAMQWLSYSYLFVRMRKNPTEYGIDFRQLRDDPSLEQVRRNFIIESGRQLDQARLIRFDESTGMFSSKDSGRLMSHYYVKFNTAVNVEETLTPTMQLGSMFQILAEASEFENMQIRKGEVSELDYLQTSSAMIEINPGASDVTGKVNTLIQAFIGRREIDSSSLSSDLNYISQNVGRIARYLFERCMHKGWASTTGMALALCKAIELQIGDCEHPLRQFRGLSQTVLKSMEDKNLTVHEIKGMEYRQIEFALKSYACGKKIKSLTEHIPIVSVSVEVQPLTSTILRIKARLVPSFKWDDHHHSGSLLAFWLTVENQDTDEILYHESVTVSKKQALGGNFIELTFAVPVHEPVPDSYMVHVTSDRWIGADSSACISLLDIVLPETCTPYTDLLDLRPLPVTALKNSAFESLYTFSHFNPIQTQIFHTIYNSDSNILLGAPTGSGKTVAAELAIFRHFTHSPSKKCVYIAPLKALVRERVKEWQIKFGEKLGKKVVELTGDVVPDMKAVANSDVIIATPEKWDGISRSWQERSFVQDVTLLIIDEIHLLGEDRGPVLEVIVSRTNFITSHTNNQIRIVGLSTALANAQDLADWLHIDQGSGGLYNFRPSVRPVPLQVHIQGFPGRNYRPRMADMNKPIFQAIQLHSPYKPVLLFVSSRQQTRITAQELMSQLATQPNPRQWTSMTDDEIEQVSRTAHDPNLKLTLAFGIGIHHAGLNTNDQSLVECLFLDKKIQLLIATSTLAWGVNFPAHMVIVKGTEFFDGHSKRFVDYPVTDVLQMMGRAGRPQFDDNGKAVVMVHDIKKEFYKKFMYEPFPVESSLLKVLSDHLNAEITSGTICSKQSAMDYLTLTFFFRRLLKNPSYYNLESVNHNTINIYLSGLVEKIVSDLEASHCLEVEEDGNCIKPTVMGRIASYYYLKHKSVRMFQERLSSKMTLNEILDIMSLTEEFAEMPVRHNEDAANQELSTQIKQACPDTVKSALTDMDCPHTKTMLLVQAHLTRLSPLPVADYAVDTKLVLDQVLRVLQAMLDSAGSEGWFATSLRVVQATQMLVQAQWVHDHPLLQLPHLRHEHLANIRSRTGRHRQIDSIPELVRAVGGTYNNLKSIVASGQQFSRQQLQQILTVLQRFPELSVSMKLRKMELEDNQASVSVSVGESDVPTSVFADCQYVLHVRLHRTNFGSNNSRIPRAHAPRFPKPKDEGYILLLGDRKSGELLVLKRVPLVRAAITNIQLEFTSPHQEGRAELHLYVMSDCYRGLDQELQLLLNVCNSC